MKIGERSFVVPKPPRCEDVISYLRQSLEFQMHGDEMLLRFVVPESDGNHFRCEVDVVEGVSTDVQKRTPHPFDFRERRIASTNEFNAVLLIPTGIGAEIGGHAGDATPVARLIGEACDHVVLHPNVVNASDINEMPDNALYVEGSIATRFLMGTVGLQKSRSNRVLVLLDEHMDSHFVDAAVNSVGAARATYGFDCRKVICLRPSIRMFAEYAESGRAVGRVTGLEHCLDVVDSESGNFDAIAISSIIRVPQEYHLDYFRSGGKMVNPWGGVEAMLTHAISSFFNVPTAHAPMFESKKIENLETGIVDPRMSAEAVSVSFLQCVLKGLHKSPRIISDEQLFSRSDVFSVEDVSCLIIPDGCLGLPTLAALGQGIPVIAVRENRNLMRNDLECLPWREGQFIRVDNYLEAVGVMHAIKAGVTIESVRRPISRTQLVRNRSIEKREISGEVG